MPSITCGAGEAPERLATDVALLTVLVLSDGDGVSARETALVASSVADRVVILERGRPSDAAGDFETLAVDWTESDDASAAIGELKTRWILVLGAGEALELDGVQAARSELAGLGEGAVEIAVGAGAEVRLHAPVAGAIEAVGGSAERRVTTMRVGSSGPAPVEPPAPATQVAQVAQPAPVAPPDPVGSDPAAAEALRERVEAIEERRLLDIVRRGRDVCWVEDDGEAEPLVTIRIPTVNRGQLIVDRALASALAQTYERLEVLVVGDGCDAETERAVRSVRDPRVRFVNLPARGIYPEDRMQRWMVAGSAAVNAAVTLAEGAWIAPCDDDDELTPDHVEVLLGEAKRRRLEFVYSKARMETEPGRWTEIGGEPLRHGHVSHGTVLYSAGLRFFRYSNTSWKLGEPSDWNLWRRMRDAGVRMGFADEVTYVHYLEAYKRDRSARLHLGCGPNRLEGWTNIDVDAAWGPDVVQDLRLGLPAEPGTVELIYSEHFFEHIPLADGLALLDHCRRALRPGGVIRIAMPDLRAVVDAYLGDWRDQVWLQDPAYASIDSAAHMLNYSVREWGHQYLYDAGELRRRLEQVGFRDVEQCALNESTRPELRNLETRPDSKLIMEAVAP